MKIPFRRPILASALALAFPAHALACAVCAGGNPANRFAFFGSTIVLSLLPALTLTASMNGMTSVAEKLRPTELFVSKYVSVKGFAESL